MKNNYLKSVGLVLLGIILSTIVFSFSSRKITKHYKKEKSRTSLVDTATAKQEIAAYQMWLKFLPKYVKLDTVANTISYPDIVEVSEEDKEILLSYYEVLHKENPSAHITLNHIPFHTSATTSYYISREDIDKAFSYDENASGIHVYLAFRGLEKMSLSTFESHLFVVPTQKLSDTVVEDQLIRVNESLYALDLTDPCPALCDKESILYNPKLHPYKGN